MGLLFKKQHTHFSSLPAVPQIDHSNPITKDIQTLFWMAGGELRDLVNNARPTSNTGTIKYGKIGAGTHYSSQKTVFANTGGRYDFTGAFSLAVIFDIDTLDYVHLVSCIASNVANGFELRGGGASGDGSVYFKRANSTRKEYRSDLGLLTAGSKNNYVGISCKDGEISTAPTVYNVNGLEVTQSPLLTGTGIQNGSSLDLYLGQRQAGTTELNGNLYMVALWRRELTFSEHESLRLNPYQLFTPQQIYIPTASGAAIEYTGLGAAVFNKRRVRYAR